jgi:hypothetical protein
VAALRLPYAQGEVNPSELEPLLDLWRRATPSAPWLCRAEALHDVGWDWFEVSGLTAFSDWAIGTHPQYLPLSRR